MKDNELLQWSHKIKRDAEKAMDEMSLEESLEYQKMLHGSSSRSNPELMNAIMVILFGVLVIWTIWRLL